MLAGVNINQLGRVTAGVLVLVSVVLASSCTHLGYYAQSIWGHTRILAKRHSIESLLDDGETPEPLQAQLEAVLAIREFATQELGLPDNGSYRSYAHLERPYAVWNVVAAPELSLAPREWCFPFAGCVTYRGYFSQRRAERFADRLRARGNDVDVAGVTAYSTIGWLKDPVLSTFAFYPPAELAGLIFHELAHQVVYVKDDTNFNESFATAVELEGVRRWLESLDESDQLERYQVSKRREKQILELLLSSRQDLEEVYASDQSEEWKRQKKRELLRDLETRYARVTAPWGGHPGYDLWFADGLNNAHLASVGAYYEHVPAFQALLDRRGGDLQAFFDEVKRLAELPREERLQRLSGSTTD